MHVPETMRALRFSAHGGPEVLELARLPVPSPGPGEVLVRVHAAGINPVDVGILGYPLPFVDDLRLPAVPGWDVAGTIAAVGPAAAGSPAGQPDAGFSVGDEVFGLARFPRLGNGTFSEYAAVPAADLARKPDGLSWPEAGALPLVALTALRAFAAVGGIQPGSRVLIEAAGGGVGHIAVQLAKAGGATVIGTASSPRHGFLLATGVDEAIDYTTTDNVYQAAAPVHGAVVSTTETALTQAVSAVEPGGFVVSILPGFTPEITALADKRGLRQADFLVAADGAGMRQVADLIRDGKLHVEVADAYPLDRAAEAYRRVATRRTTGKVVLLPVTADD